MNYVFQINDGKLPNGKVAKFLIEFGKNLFAARYPNNCSVKVQYDQKSRFSGLGVYSDTGSLDLQINQASAYHRNGKDSAADFEVLPIITQTSERWVKFAGERIGLVYLGSHLITELVSAVKEERISVTTERTGIKMAVLSIDDVLKPKNFADRWLKIVKVQKDIKVIDEFRVVYSNYYK
jgi:hypothetical protein